MKYYMINDGINPDTVYGGEHLVCLDETEVKRLCNEWKENLFAIMHEASDCEIEEYGVYDS